MKMTTLRSIMVVALMGLALNASAYPFVTCTSTYLTNGWFQYELTLHDDPFFAEVDMLSLQVPLTTNPLAVGPLPAGWTVDASSNGVAWTLAVPPPPDIPDPLARPLTAQLSFQSPYATYRMATNALLIPFIGVINDFAYTRFGSITLVGLFKLNGLVPCPPAQADGSPATLTTVGEAVPDIKLLGFLTLSNQPHGVRYTWDGPSTMIVQSSQNGTTWSNIAYTLGNAGANAWTSPVPLDTAGTFFRLRLYSTQQHPELVH